MKNVYGKLENTKLVYFSPVKGGIEADGKIIITNDESVYNKYGWYRVENVDEVGTDHVDGNVLYHYTGVERTLEMAKQEKIAEIEVYDTSNAVNGFTLDGQQMWLSLEERKNMRQSLIALKAQEIETFTYWNGLIPITMPVAQFEAIMNVVEVYALQCFNVTAQHKATVEELTSIEEADTFDVTIGYPDKLSF